MPHSQKAQTLQSLNLPSHPCIYKEKGHLTTAVIQDITLTESSYFITLSLPPPYPSHPLDLGGSLEYLTLTDAALTMSGYVPFIIIHRPDLVAHVTALIHNPDFSRGELRQVINQIASKGQIPT